MELLNNNQPIDILVFFIDLINWSIVFLYTTYYFNGAWVYWPKINYKAMYYSNVSHPSRNALPSNISLNHYYMGIY